MLQKIGDKAYKSPLHKLIRFFEQSRDGWKEKYGNVKAHNKSLQNRVRYLEKTKSQWKREALQLRKEASKLRSERSRRGRLYGDEDKEKKVVTNPRRGM
jgi:peptidoglycan hydrolase CwlO-like protein